MAWENAPNLSLTEFSHIGRLALGISSSSEALWGQGGSGGGGGKSRHPQVQVMVELATFLAESSVKGWDHALEELGGTT